MNIEQLDRQYFYFDKPVPYEVDGGVVLIYPIELMDSELFLASCDILVINKNVTPSVEIIQMSYLEFLVKEVLREEVNRAKLQILLKYCLHLEKPRVVIDGNKYLIADDEADVLINSRQFEDIRRIIMYQNVLHYDDSYVDSDLKKAMEETDALKHSNTELPSVERKMAIITAHCGMPKSEQLKMTYRSHCLLFEEVSGEVEFSTARLMVFLANMFSGKKGRPQEIDHWIYRKKKGKFDGYVTELNQHTSKFGADANLIPNASASEYDALYHSLNKT